MNTCMLILLSLLSLSSAERLLKMLKLLMLSLVALPKVPVAAECHWRANANGRAEPVGHRAVQKPLMYQTVAAGCKVLKKSHLNQICIPLLFSYQNNCNSDLKVG